MKTERLELKNFEYGNQTPIHLQETEEKIGEITLKDAGDNASTIEVFIEESFRNNGYGFESIVALIDHAFIDLEKHEIIMEKGTDDASKHLLKKLGFLEEGDKLSMTNPNEGDNDYLIDPKLIQEYLDKQKEHDAKKGK